MLKHVRQPTCSEYRNACSLRMATRSWPKINICHFMRCGTTQFRNSDDPDARAAVKGSAHTPYAHTAQHPYHVQHLQYLMRFKVDPEQKLTYFQCTCRKYIDVSKTT